MPHTLLRRSIVESENGDAYSSPVLHAATHLIRSDNVHKQGTNLCEDHSGAVSASDCFTDMPVA